MNATLGTLAADTLASIDHGYCGEGVIPRALNALEAHGLGSHEAVAAAFVVSDLIRDDIVGAVELWADELTEAVTAHPIVGAVLAQVLNAANRYTEPLALSTLLAASLAENGQ